MKSIPKPEPNEYAAYASMYISLLPDDGLILKHLEDNLRGTTEFLCTVPKEKLAYRYAEGKCTIKETPQPHEPHSCLSVGDFLHCSDASF